MEENLAKPATVAIQGLILVFAFCLIWFAFVYYPGITHDRNFLQTLKAPFQKKIVASSSSFPIETKNYRITYEQGSNLYYVFLSGDSVNVYVENKNVADLALKNALSVETLCSVKVIYASSANIAVPAQYRNTSNCN